MTRTIRVCLMGFFLALFLPLVFAQGPVPLPEPEAVRGMLNKWRYAVEPIKGERGTLEERKRAMDGLLVLCQFMDHTRSGMWHALMDDDPEIRIKACKVIGANGTHQSNTSSVSGLLELLKKEKLPEVKTAAIAALAGIYWQGGNASHLRQTEHLRERTTVVATLVHVMRNDDDNLVRWKACNVFRLMGPSADAAAPALLDVILTEKIDGEMRRKAARSLCDVATPSLKGIAPSILKAYTKGEEDPEVESTMLAILGKIGEDVDGIMPILIRALKDGKKPRAQSGAVGAIGHLGPRAKNAVPTLIELLDTIRPKKSGDEEDTKCYSFISALIRIGPEARAAIPILKTIANRPGDFHCTDTAKQAINIIGGKTK